MLLQGPYREIGLYFSAQSSYRYRQRCLREFFSFHPDLPTHLNHIHVSDQRCIQPLDSCHACSVLSRDCRKRIATLHGIVNRLRSALYVKQLVYLCLNGCVVISCGCNAALSIRSVTPLSSQNLSGKFLHRLSRWHGSTRLNRCDSLRISALLRESVESASLDDGRKVLIRNIHIHPAADAVHLSGRRILPDSIGSTIGAFGCILCNPMGEWRELRIIQSVAESGIGGTVDPGVISSRFHRPAECNRCLSRTSLFRCRSRLNIDIHRVLELLSIELCKETLCIRFSICRRNASRTYEVIGSDCNAIILGSFIVLLPSGIGIKTGIGSACLDDCELKYVVLSSCQRCFLLRIPGPLMNHCTLFSTNIL